MTHPLLGPAFPEAGWVPAPRYLLRRARILALTRDLRPGRLLEVGPGAGALLIEFASRGFACEGLESSAEARTMAARLVRQAGREVEIHAAPGRDWAARYDLLFAFEVLEHIEHHVAALREWHEWLKPGGALLLSVPARMSRWSAGDEWAGHFRRYEKEALAELTWEAGFTLERLECYGFPLTNLSERLNVRAYRKGVRGRSGAPAADRALNNERSGVDRRHVLRWYPLIASWPGRLGLRCFMMLQNRHLNRDWGTGYLVRARKR